MRHFICLSLLACAAAFAAAEDVALIGVIGDKAAVLALEGGGLDQALLGIGFLNRTEMQRDGATMTLIQRF